MAAAGGLAWGHFEAGWVQLRVRDVAVQGLPPELDGLRIAHLSDFHLGMPSRGVRAVARAVRWVAERKPDLVCITGDLLSRARGQPRLNELLERLPSDPYIVLGNHDFALSRDPFSEPVQLGRLTRGTLLADQSVTVELHGVAVEIAGVDPRSWLSYRTSRFEPSDAPLRILLCHFPRALDYVPEGRWQLILSGHLHGGQIVLPYGPEGRLLLAHPSSRYRQGLYSRGNTTMHVSPGLGTTFVPFRYFARPEATELVLRSG
ncbi:MAG TPA: metallophosphoesterase [Gaiellaceae bacterium]|nr:metallophosphoesterase [Gaiellaceae bacterium]